MVVLPGCCRDREDAVWSPPFETRFRFLRADQIFREEWGITIDEWEAYWVELDEADGYFLNNYGEVFSYHSGRYLKPKPMDKHGHMGFCLMTPTGRTYVYRDRLLAKYFIPNPNNYPVVRHLNDDPNDCDLSNLAWGTQKDNHDDCVRNGHVYYLTNEDREKGFELFRTPVIATNLKTGRKKRFRGQGEAGRELGIQQANIWKVLRGQRKQTGGYHFEYDR